MVKCVWVITTGNFCDERHNTLVDVIQTFSPSDVNVIESEFHVNLHTHIKDLVVNNTRQQ